MGRFNIDGTWYDAASYGEARTKHLQANPAKAKGPAGPPQPAPPDFGAQLKAKVDARENRVVVRQHTSLVFKMEAPTYTWDFDFPLRYNLRKTGLGKQDLEITVSLPILVHEGAAAKQYWTSLGYAADDFDKTAHAPQKAGVVGATAGEVVIRNWTKSINHWWGNAAVIHHPDGGPNTFYRLRFEFAFTDDPGKACKQVACVRTTGEAATANANGTIDAVRWGAADAGPGGPICHEVGHFLGCPDEYFKITYDGRTVQWPNGYTAGEAIMNNPNEKPLARHYRKMGQELANQFGFPAAEASIILNVGLGLDNAAQKRHKLTGHIWDGV